MQSFSRSDSVGNYLLIIAFQGEVPIFDFRTQVYADNSQEVLVSCSYIHIRGIIVQGAGNNGIQFTGSNNVIEQCTFRWNCDSSMQMKTEVIIIYSIVIHIKILNMNLEDLPHLFLWVMPIGLPINNIPSQELILT